MSEGTEEFITASPETRIKELLSIASLMLMMAEKTSHLPTWTPAVEEWIDNYEAHLGAVKAGK